MITCLLNLRNKDNIAPHRVEGSDVYSIVHLCLSLGLGPCEFCLKCNIADNQTNNGTMDFESHNLLAEQHVVRWLPKTTCTSIAGSRRLNCNRITQGNRFMTLANVFAALWIACLSWSDTCCNNFPWPREYQNYLKRTLYRDMLYGRMAFPSLHRSVRLYQVTLLLHIPTAGNPTVVDTRAKQDETTVDENAPNKAGNCEAWE